MRACTHAPSYTVGQVLTVRFFHCELRVFFHNSQSKESQEKEYAINNILPAWQFAIIKIAIWLVQRHLQSFNYAIKTRPTVYAHAIRANERSNDAYACIYN